MKRDLLAKSLAQMGSKAEVAPQDTAPKSLKSMSDVLSQVSAQAAQEVPVSDIADSDIADRFDVTDGLDDLIESIRTSGQQLPALLRYRRGAGPRYEVVYGRRRIAACRALGIPVKAFIREMDQREALMSQALENSARLERSFIEQAIFATKLEEQGFTRAEIGEVLAVDKGTLSKLIGVARDVPDAVIYRIGAAHDAGRRPWLELRKLVKSEGAPDGEALLALVPEEGAPADKLARTIKALQSGPPKPPAPPEPPLRPVYLTTKNTAYNAQVQGTKLVVEMASAKEKDFVRYLEENLDILYETWKLKH